MAIVVYKGKRPEKNSWIRYLLHRINRENKNNLIAVVGKTGSGKTWSAISICEMISKKTKVPFDVDHIVFGLKELMTLINSGKLKKGSCIIFDEPQVSISSREFMTETNKVFNYLLSTFRHRNLNLFFCTPFEDLLDLSCRKLFHSKFLTISIDRETKVCKIKPMITEYNSFKKKFYEKFLRISYKPNNKSSNITKKLRYWSIPKPNEELIKQYENKKWEFTNRLNEEIEQRLEKYEFKNKIVKKELTEKQEVIFNLLKNGMNVKEVSDKIGTSITNVYNQIKMIRNKGYTWGRGTQG